jgi:hypothetical protein
MLSVLKLAVNPASSAVAASQFPGVFQEEGVTVVFHVPSAAKAAGASRSAEVAVRTNWIFRDFMMV